MSSTLYAYKKDIDTALRAFSRSSNRAIKRLYASHPRKEKEVYLGRDEEMASDYSSVSSDDDDSSHDSVTLQDGPNEAVFLMYL